MIKLGMPTLIETQGIEDCAALCRQLGMQFIELNMNLPEYQIDAIDADALLRIAESYGVSYTLHLDENLNPCDFNAAIAQAYTETVRRAIAVAKRLRMPVLNMHMAKGVYFTLPGRRVYLFERYEQHYLTRLKAFRDACRDAIGDADMHICIENCGGYPAYQQAGIDMLLESPCFALTYDIGHAHSAGYADEAFILSRSHRLKHMHLHDANAAQNHLPLGEGDVNLPAYLQLAQQHACSIVIEAKTIAGLQASAAWLSGAMPGLRR